jgi:hypothetical protein
VAQRLWQSGPEEVTNKYRKVTMRPRPVSTKREQPQPTKNNKGGEKVGNQYSWGATKLPSLLVNAFLLT